MVDPLLDFLTRPGAVLILAFVALFKLGEAMGGIITAPILSRLGFSRDAIAGSGPFSLVATLAGITFGGWSWSPASAWDGRCCGPARRKPWRW